MQKEIQKQTWAYEKGYFVDFKFSDHKWQQYRIKEVLDNKVMIENCRCSGTYPIDVGSSKLKPFRMETKPLDEIYQENRWAPTYDDSLQTLKKVNSGYEMSSYEFVQYFRGGQHFMIMNLMRRSTISQQNVDVLIEIVKQFVVFLGNFWRFMNAHQILTGVNIYQNDVNAKLSCYSEILIDLKHMIDIAEKGVESEEGNPIKPILQNWLVQHFIPSTLKQQLTLLNADQLLKVMYVFIKCTNNNFIHQSKQFENAKNKILDLLKLQFQKTPLKRYDEYYKSVKHMMGMLPKQSQDFRLCYELYLILLLRFLDLANQPFMMSSNSSSYRFEKLSNNINIVFEAMKNSDNTKLLKRYLHHENGLLFYIKYASIQSFKYDFKRIYSFVGDYIIRCIVKLKKTDMIRLIEKWTIPMIHSAVSEYLKHQQSKADDLMLAIELHKIMNSSNRVIFGATLPSLSQQHKQEMEEESKNTVDLADMGQSDDVMTEQRRNNAARNDNDLVLEERQLLMECLNRIQKKILILCEILYDANERTLIVNYVEQNIIIKGISSNSVEFMDCFDSKEINTFKESFMFTNYLKKLEARKNTADFKDCIFSAFNSLIETMLCIKNRTLFEHRKTNIKQLIKCSLTNFSYDEAIQMICLYVDKIKEISVRQAKHKSFDFIQEFLSSSPISSNKPLFVEAISKILSHMRIDSMGQFKIYLNLFNIVNVYNKKIKINSTTGMLVAVYDVPDGMEGFFEVLHCCQTEKNLMKKTMSFFSKIQFKILDLSVRNKIVYRLCESLVESLNVVSKFEALKMEDAIKETVLSIEELMREQEQFANENSYSQLFLAENYVALEDDQSQVYQVIVTNEGSNEHEDSEMEDEQSLAHFTASANERLFSIKYKASVELKFPLFSSNLFVGHQKLELTQQQITIDELIKCHPECIEVESINKSGHSEDRLLDQGQDKRIIKITIKPSPYSMQRNVKRFLLNHLDKIFKCLPHTKIIWASLRVSSQEWFQNQKLIQIRQSFLKSCESKAHRKDPLWISIMNDSIKKMFLLEALFEDEDILNLNPEWIFETLCCIKDKYDIDNSLNSLRLIEKIRPELSSNNAISLLDMLKIDEGISLNEMREIDNDDSYHNLISKVIEFIQKQAKFSLFNFLMRVPISFFMIDNSNSCLIQWMHILFIKEFKKFVSQNPKDFDTKMFNYLERQTPQFQYFLSIFQVAPEEATSAQERDFMRQAYTSWLACSIKYLIKKNEELAILSNEYLPVTKSTLVLIYCLLQKQIQCSLLNCPQLKEILMKGLTLKLSAEAIKIIKIITYYFPKEGEFYISYFEKEMRESQWERQLVIKSLRKNMKGESGFVGLRNLDSICYANSLFQQLYHIIPFRKRLYETDWKRNDNLNQDLVYQLKKIFLNLEYLQSNDYVNETFFEAFKNDQGGPTNVEVQMDVDEFRSILLDRIENLVLKKEGESRNFIQQIFNGKQVTLIKSKECQHESSREEDFSTICLEVKGLKTLQNSLDHYLKAETLDGDDKYSCDSCKKKVAAEKMNRIKEYPPYLTFVLKRFEYLMQYRKKINQKFEFPLDELTMDQDNAYRLKGIIIHEGISEAGHYFSIIRIHERWFKFNDSQITELSTEDVVALSFGEQTLRCNRNAYLLIYQKVDQSLEDEEGNEEEFKGMEGQLRQVSNYNRLVWKSDLFLGPNFDKFLQVCIQKKIEGASSLLLQYILTIKSKTRSDIGSIKDLFTMLKRSMNGPILTSEARVNWLIHFYFNHYFDVSAKTAMSEIIAESNFVFDDYAKKLLKQCLIILHSEVETAPFFNLMYILCKKDIEVVKYLNESRIIGRVLDITITKLILSNDREELSKSSFVQFPLIDHVKAQKKRLCEESSLRYHKWRLVHFVLSSNLSLHPVQLNHLQVFNERRFAALLQDASSKACLNQISKVLLTISMRFPKFGNAYLEKIVQCIGKHESENAKKFLKCASDLLGINDQRTVERAQKIKSKFAVVLNQLWRQKMSFSFDIKWQWFIKMGLKHRQFRRIVRESQDEFKVINSKSQLQMFYSRNSVNSESRQKNRYYGLLFGPTTNFVQKKYELSRLIFQGDEQEIVRQNEVMDYDKDLTDYPDLALNSRTYIRKYHDQSGRFMKVEAELILGDLLRIDDFSFDRGDQKLMPYFEVQGELNEGQESS